MHTLWGIISAPHLLHFTRFGTFIFQLALLLSLLPLEDLFFGQIDIGNTSSTTNCTPKPSLSDFGNYTYFSYYTCRVHACQENFSSAGHQKSTKPYAGVQIGNKEHPPQAAGTAGPRSYEALSALPRKPTAGARFCCPVSCQMSETFISPTPGSPLRLQAPHWSGAESP